MKPQRWVVAFFLLSSVWYCMDKVLEAEGSTERNIILGSKYDGERRGHRHKHRPGRRHHHERRQDRRHRQSRPSKRHHRRSRTVASKISRRSHVSERKHHSRPGSNSARFSRRKRSQTATSLRGGRVSNMRIIEPGKGRSPITVGPTFASVQSLVPPFEEPDDQMCCPKGYRPAKVLTIEPAMRRIYATPPQSKQADFALELPAAPPKVEAAAASDATVEVNVDRERDIKTQAEDSFEKTSATFEMKSGAPAAKPAPPSSWSVIVSNSIRPAAQMVPDPQVTEATPPESQPTVPIALMEAPTSRASQQWFFVTPTYRVAAPQALFQHTLPVASYHLPSVSSIRPSEVFAVAPHISAEPPQLVGQPILVSEVASAPLYPNYNSAALGIPHMPRTCLLPCPGQGLSSFLNRGRVRRRMCWYRYC